MIKYKRNYFLTKLGIKLEISANNLKLKDITFFPLYFKQPVKKHDLNDLHYKKKKKKKEFQG